MEGNLPFVRAIAAKVKEQLPNEIEFDDLVGYGAQGLIEAADRFDGTHGATFTTYAYYRVRGAMFDGLRRMGWLPRGEYARARFGERATAYLGNLAERDRGGDQYGGGDDNRLEDDVRDLANALGGIAAIFVASLSTAEEEAILDPEQTEHSLERRETQSAVREVVETLPEKERRLIQLYYFEEKTFEEIGALLGLSKSWTSRLHARAVDLLHAGLTLRDPLDEMAAAPARRRRASSRR